ncbi:restriction endonuclease subunit S [Candidatus Magnetaquicoccus inordinatus]|uniref:restriction endonuclease subunit S n=1 Tax=Candidatus Magnetaquicoccus inordinatus TaxID=2496818 RepID=UPI00102B07C8|nr:restriction endonuclease subunit S [Candidatus Magnetaquicoccus inordinatus]
MKSHSMTQLGKCTKFIRGITFKPADVISADDTGAVVCMRTKNIQSTLDESDLIAVPKSFVKREEQFLEEKDILISSANSWNLVGKCVQVPRLEYHATAGGFISIVRPDRKRVDPDYLYRWMSSGESQDKIRHLGRQTTNISNLDVSRFRQLEIPLPPLPEQKRIAAILDKADAIRRKRRQALALADQFLRSVFLEMFGDPVTNPKGWKVERLDQVADIASGVTKGKQFNGKKTVHVPYMRVANVQDGHIDISDVQDIEVLETDMGRYLLKSGDILLTEGGDPDKLGRGAVWQGGIDPCIHQNHIFKVRVDQNFAIPEFMSALIGSQRGKRYFLMSAKQTTGIASINKTQLCGFPALLPPLDIQREYLSHVRGWQSEQEKFVTLGKGSDDLFGSLTQHAFRGEL